MSTAHDWLRRDGMTVRAIAKVLHISPMRVRQLEQRALEKLRESGVLNEFLGINGTIDSEHHCGVGDGMTRPGIGYRHFPNCSGIEHR